MKKLLLTLLLLLPSILTAQDIVILGPSEPIQRGTWEMLIVTGLDEKDLPGIVIEITPSDGVQAQPNSWGGNFSVWFRSSKPGKYTVTIGMNRWRQSLDASLTAAKKAKIPQGELAEIELLVNKFVLKYPVKAGTALLEVAGSIPPPPPVDPPVDPVTTGKRLVVIVHEQTETLPLTVAEWTNLRDGANGQYLKDKGHRVYILDKDSKDENNAPSPILAPYLELVRKDNLPLPAMFIADLEKGSSAVFFKGKPPETSGGIIEAIKKAGG